ncbi:MAG TPA: septum formation initiator family protein [Sphingobacteriaceae bacterium]|nr:septum formation initiator family protein [Sphingobacteriaceae bacterium]
MIRGRKAKGSGRIRRRGSAGKARGRQELRLVPPQQAVRERFRLPVGEDGSGEKAAARERSRLGGLPWNRIIVLAAVVYFLITFVSQEAQFASLRQEIYRLQGEIALRQAEVEALRERRDYLSSPAYVVAEARRRFNLTRPGEIHYLTIWEEGEEEFQAAGQDEEEELPEEVVPDGMVEDPQEEAGR